MMSLAPSSKNQVFFGSFIHCKELGELEYIHNAAVFVDGSGTIVAIEPNCNQQKAVETVYAKLGWSLDDVAITAARDGRQFYFPGFIDTHIHASQYPNAGLFGKSTLLDWLNTYTFPMEASLSILSKARKAYARCIKRTLSHGTTTAVYYATIDVEATNLLADLCLSIGQRAFVGRVCMDHLGPDYYKDESVSEMIRATRSTISYIQSIDQGAGLVTPIITPRFAPACSTEALSALAALQRETSLPVQTHICENENEIALVRELFPESRDYADVYDSAGLLTDHMILAHAVHLTDAETDVIAARGSKISHCPCSNSALTSGVAKVRSLLDRGIDVGLGTDVSGGYSPSVLEAARLAKMVSNHLVMPGGALAGMPEPERERAKLGVEEVLYLATRGGARVIGLADKIGGFEVGKQWDAQLVDLGRLVPDDDDDECDFSVRQNGGNVDIFGWESWEERVAKWVFNGDDRNTKKVWVRGRLVHELK
ncbi:guanine deaminase [Xylariaceae sp. FL0255]|nr:guanine deaminase [Xylariaceae sp. FL0255]